MSLAATCSTQPATTEPTWRLLDGSAPSFVSFAGRELRFTAELERGEDDCAEVYCVVEVVDFCGGTPCCELVRVDVELATDATGCEAWVRENIGELADKVRYQ